MAGDNRTIRRAGIPASEVRPLHNDYHPAMIVNRQREVRVRVQALNAFLAEACQALRVSPDSLSVCLVTNSEMARWNRIYRGKNRATDVLSFPAQSKKIGATRINANHSADRQDAGDYLGDIAIAPGVARRNAESDGREFDDEMRILIVHGILHLLGYDHEADTGQMERRERRVRRTLGLS